MIVSIIVAMAENRAIGVEGRLPWHLSSDLKRFKRLTMGHHLIMGRKTFESIGRPLPGRVIIVLSRDPAYRAAGSLKAVSLEAALAIAAERQEEEVFICGGEQVYARALDLADRIYMTLVHANPQADTHFPNFDSRAWIESWSEYHPGGERDQHPFTFKILEKQSQRAEPTSAPSLAAGLGEEADQDTS